MAFVPIKINEYVSIHLKNNPKVNKEDLINRLKKALYDYENGLKCSCKNDIWVVGSASVGNSCYSCITGESYPNEDYEIESAIRKIEYEIHSDKHTDEIPKGKINGFFDDEGKEININFIKKPSLCITCINDDNPEEEMLCNMIRHDQKDQNEFICGAYKDRND